MHYHEIYSDDEAFGLNVNGDFSGDVLFQIDPYRVEWLDLPAPGVKVYEVKIPFAVIEELVGRKHAQRAIARIEPMSGREFLERG